MRTRKLATKVIDGLRARGLTLVTAESLTGGLIGSVLTSIPGASDSYWGGVVSYSIDAKERLLGVSAGTIAQYGVVSGETASEMAEGACMASGADVAVAVTGVAGPSGGSPETPVGTVYIACALKGRDAVAIRIQERGSRDRVRRLTVVRALSFVLDCLDRNR